MQNDPEPRKTKLLSPVGVKAKFCFMDSLCNEIHLYVSGFVQVCCGVFLKIKEIHKSNTYTCEALFNEFQTCMFVWFFAPISSNCCPF